MSTRLTLLIKRKAEHSPKIDENHFYGV